MKRRAFLILLLAVAAFGIARADDLPDAATLRERIDAAAGRPAEWSETETYRSQRRSGERRTYVRGKDARTVTIDDGIETERGTFHGRSWHRTSNGVTVPHPAASGTPAPLPSAVVARDPRARDRYIISRLDRRGFGTRDWIDAGTYTVVRREVLSPNGTITTDYDDFRDVGGRRPFHWTVHDDITRETLDYRRTSFQIANVRAEDVVMPESRSFVSLPSANAGLTLPVTWAADGSLQVPVTIGAHTYTFVLDSGAGGIFIDPEVARELALPLHGEHSTVVTGRFTTANAVVPQMSVGPIVLHNAVMGLAPQPVIAGHRTSDGILGFDFIESLGLTIDFEARKVVAVPISAYRPPDHAITFDVDLSRDVPFTRLVVNESAGDRFIFDTGSPLSLVVFDYFTLAHPNAVPRGPTFGGFVRGLGIGGAVDARRVRIDRLQLGPYRLSEVAGYRFPGTTGFTAFTDGLLGTGVLRFFTVDFDLRHAKVYLRLNGEGLSEIELAK